MGGYTKYKKKGRYLDLIGERFERLVVTRKAMDEYDEKSGKFKSAWYCDCDCGTKDKIVRGSSLTSGKVRSCGCLHKEVSSVTARTKISHGAKENIYDLSGEYGIGYDLEGNKFLFDLEDYEKLKEVYWSIDKHGYMSGHKKGTNGEAKQHRYLFDIPEEIVVDHKNHDEKADNRKSNLRLTVQQQNAKNKRYFDSGVFSGVVEKKGKYDVSIFANRNMLFLGTYENLEDAIYTRLFAEVELYGEYSSRSVPEEYKDMKKEILTHFKGVQTLRIAKDKEFLSWIRGDLLYDDEKDKFGNEGMSLADYLRKHIKMEFYYKLFGNFVAWGHFGMVLKDIKDSVIFKTNIFTEDDKIYLIDKTKGDDLSEENN